MREIKILGLFLLISLNCSAGEEGEALETTPPKKGRIKASIPGLTPPELSLDTPHPKTGWMVKSEHRKLMTLVPYQPDDPGNKNQLPSRKIHCTPVKAWRKKPDSMWDKLRKTRLKMQAKRRAEYLISDSTSSP